MKDEDLAGLLGEAPRTPDPSFRVNVVARVADRARRRAAAGRAARTVAAFTALGLFFPLVQAAGFTLHDVQPLFYSAAVVGLTYLFAVTTVQGRRSLLARSLAAFRYR